MNARNREQTRKVRRRALYALISFFVLLLLYFAFAPGRISVETASVTRGKFEEIIAAEGRLRSKDVRLITAFADGRLGRVSLRPGDPVKKGETITTLYWDRDRPIRSPINGVVSRVFRESAGEISRAESIVEIVNPTDLEIVVEMLTTDAVRVNEGDQMRIETATDQPPLHAKVTRVSKAGFIKRSALGVEEERTEVLAQASPSDSERMTRFGHNFHIETATVVTSVEDALKLPIGAVFRHKEGFAVYRIVKGRAVLTPIRIIRRGLDEVQVGEGVTEGDIVVLYPGDLIRDGTKVTST